MVSAFHRDIRTLQTPAAYSPLCHWSLLAGTGEASSPNSFVKNCIRRVSQSSCTNKKYLQDTKEREDHRSWLPILSSVEKKTHNLILPWLISQTVNACQAVTPNSGLSQGVAEIIPLWNLMYVLLSPQVLNSSSCGSVAHQTRGNSSTAAHDSHFYQWRVKLLLSLVRIRTLFSFYSPPLPD